MAAGGTRRQTRPPVGSGSELTHYPPPVSPSPATASARIWRGPTERGMMRHSPDDRTSKRAWFECLGRPARPGLSVLADSCRQCTLRERHPLENGSGRLVFSNFEAHA